MLEKFREKFRVERDAQGDPIIKCRLGFVYEMGPDSLGVWIESGKPTASIKAIQARGFPVEKTQLGDHEATVRWRTKGFEEDCRFLRVIGAHRRRYLKQEQKQAAVARLSSFKFQKGHARPTPTKSLESGNVP